jgi:hypothetical protein
MGLFETPLVLGVVTLLVVALVAIRWRKRRTDEWRDEAHPAPAEPGSVGDAKERP